MQILCRIFIIKDVGAWMKKVAGDEAGFSRALTLGDVLTLNRNVFGGNPKLRVTDWLEPEDKTWAVLRDGAWRVPKLIDDGRSGSVDSRKFGVGPPPPELMDRSRLKHSDRLILSPVDLPLWDRAKWRATMFGWYPGTVPFLALVFENGKAGQDIFRAWLERWGQEDKDEALRLAIIRGLSGQRPAEYAVVVGPSLRGSDGQKGKTVMYVSRINRMTPTTTTNLDTFITEYQKAGAFLLAPAEMGPDGPNPFLDFSIGKRSLEIRQAWEIGENDPDISALDDDDQPIIPVDIADPPVVRALERIREIRRRRGV
jgi:hypothetical protein